MSIDIELTINGRPTTVRAAPGDRLLDLLRGPLGLTGTKEGCGNGECGACTVIVDERPVNACLYPAAEAHGRSVLTVEGLGGERGRLGPSQSAFVDEAGTQCGFCTPGMLMATEALLRRHPDPSDEQIRAALVGNLCRCTGYVQIFASVREAAKRRRETPQKVEREDGNV